MAIRINDAREAIHDAFSIHARSGGDKFLRLAASTEKSYRDIETMLVAEILAECAKQSVISRHWLSIAYAPDSSAEANESIHHEVFDIITEGLQLRGYKKIIRLLKISQAAIDEMRSRVIAGKPKFSDADICRKLDVAPGHFERDGWKERWGQALAYLAELDCHAVAPVDELLPDLQRRMTEEAEESRERIANRRHSKAA